MNRAMYIQSRYGHSVSQETCAVSAGMDLFDSCIMCVRHHFHYTQRNSLAVPFVSDTFLATVRNIDIRPLSNARLLTRTMTDFAFFEVSKVRSAL